MLKPCPFCGNPPSSYYVSSIDIGCVRCDKCNSGVTFPGVVDWEDLERKWNTRFSEKIPVIHDHTAKMFREYGVAYCDHCGHTLSPDDLWCPGCGYDIIKE